MTNSMSDILSVVTSLVTQAITWMTSFITAITANPLLLLFVLVGFVGMGVGLIKRIIRL